MGVEVFLQGEVFQIMVNYKLSKGVGLLLVSTVVFPACSNGDLDTVRTQNVASASIISNRSSEDVDESINDDTRALVEYGGGTHLWSTKHSTERVVFVDNDKATLTIVTKEPVAGYTPLIEVYHINHTVEFVEGSFNEFVVGGWDKKPGGREFVLEVWTLPDVVGAYEVEIPADPRPEVGDSAAVNRPSGGWVVGYLDPAVREKRTPIRIKNVLRGSVGSIDGFYVDVWMRYAVILSQDDGLVYSIDLLNEPSLGVVATELDIPWLDDAGGTWNMHVVFPSTAELSGVPTGEVCFGFVGYADDGSPLDLYVITDSNNDGVWDTFTSPSPGEDPMVSFVGPYSWKNTVSIGRQFR